ncbi:Snf7 family [Coemansia mojavensis]|nr:Snf7 family [Coemansia mojavensis]
MENTVFNLKFLAKTLKRQSKTCMKDHDKETREVKKAMKSNNIEIARIHASNAIRKKNESINLLRLSSRIDAAASRIDTAAKMQRVTGSMGKVVGEIDRALQKNMNLDKVSQIMDTFESQSENLDLHAKYMEESMNSTTTMTTPQEEVDTLLQKVADEAGLEMSQELGGVHVPQEPLPEDDRLNERLANLRNAI